MLVVTAGKVPLSPKTGLPMGTDLMPNHTFRQLLARLQEDLPKRPAVRK
jgi:hypothetical protein